MHCTCRFVELGQIKRGCLYYNGDGQRDLIRLFNILRTRRNTESRRCPGDRSGPVRGTFVHYRRGGPDRGGGPKNGRHHGNTAGSDAEGREEKRAKGHARQDKVRLDVTASTPPPTGRRRRPYSGKLSANNIICPPRP